MISTAIFSGNIGGDGVVAFEANAFNEETYKYSFTAQLKCLLSVPAQSGVRMPKMRIFHNALPTMDEIDSPGSAYGLEDVPELGTCMHQEDIFLGPNRLVPEFKWIFKTGCFPADGTMCYSWLELAGLPVDSYNLVLWLNEINFPTP